ncbi:MAG: DMT family transporter [Pleurocapsa minor GSE-CHR-MK-17-07R]|jgi:drug/metabolite transporter (DMT)-like permease|nr:DMT family transporter [Pleurocapsa minor GSE-CHR-MK 17-07R]
MTYTTSAISGQPAAVPRQAYIMLAVGILAVSTAAIFIKFAQDDGVPSLVISAGRLLVSLIVLTPIVLLRYRADLSRLSRSDLLFAALAGAVLGLHFALWIGSLEFTSVLVSVVLVTTGPLWVALLEFLFLKAKITRLVALGLLLATIGSGIIGVGGGTGDDSAGSQPLLGAVMALGGAVSVAIYLLIGRKIRAKTSLIPYIWLVYGFAAIFLVLAILLTGTPVTGYPVSGAFWVALTGLVPQLIGHSSFNYVLKYLSATFVGLSSQIEPIGSAIAALIIFRQVPTVVQIIGSFVILAGVTLATYRPNPRGKP